MNKVIFLLIILLNVSIANSNNIFNCLKDSSHKDENYEVNVLWTQGINYNRNENYANFHYFNIDVGYRIKYNQEIGLSVGGDNLIWYGAYYRFYFEDNLNISLKIAKNDGIKYFNFYNELTLGKDFKITNNFYFRTQFFYSMVSKYPFGIINNRDNKFGILLGISYIE
jgi:hypothetical protein